MINFKDISFAYEGNNKILEDITFHIKRGEKVAFLGENGSGKSTLFLLINGILRAQRGKATIDNIEIKHRRKTLTEIRKRVGLVFQDPESQIIAPTLMQEVAYGLENIGWESHKVEEGVRKALGEVGLEEEIRSLCHNLSFGQKKRLCLASTFAMSPDIIVLDEPLVWLDPMNRKKVLKLLEEKNKEEKTIVFSTHDVNFAYNFADYIYILNKGRIVKQGRREEVFVSQEEMNELNLDFPEKLKIAKFIEKEYGVNQDEFLKKINMFSLD